MSRYLIKLEDNEAFAYGFDPCGFPHPHYFWQVWGEVEDEEGDPVETIIDQYEGNKTGLLLMMEDLGINMFPEEHVTAIAMDLPL